MEQVPPVLPPPLGVTSNYEDPVTRRNELVINALITPALALLFVVARISSRVMSTKLGWDDYTSVAAMACSLVYSACLIHHTDFGEGRHSWDVPITMMFPDFQIWFFVAAIFACIQTLLAKLSVLLLLDRIFSVSRKFAYVNYAVMFVVCGYLTAGLFTIIFLCVPPRKLWDPTVEGKCIDAVTTATIMSGFNVATDFAILLLPQPMVWKLQMKTRMKTGLAFVFLTGGAVCIVSIVRLCLFIQNQKEPDFTWSIVTLDVASLWEGNVSIICGCLPVIKPLLSRFLPRMLGTTFKSSKRSGDESSSSRKGAGHRHFGDYTSSQSAGITKSTTFSTRHSQSAEQADTQLGTQMRGEEWREYVVGSPRSDKSSGDQHRASEEKDVRFMTSMA